jgi:uncharacterized protein (TIGR03435 family)
MTVPAALIALAFLQAAPPAFVSASVKLNSSPGARDAQMQVLPGGKVVIRNVPLLMIVAAAWDVPFQSPRLAGGGEWQQLKGEKYDIEATAAPGAVAPELTPKERGDLIRPMMRSLLEDRFHLKMRSESKEQPVYALVVAPGGPKLEKSKIQEKDCVTPVSGQPPCHRAGGGQTTGIHGDAISMDDVALFVQNWTDRPVIDKTGLTELFNIQTGGWTPMGTAKSGGTDLPSLADVFRELGIGMESQKAVVEMFVVEHVERPAAN